MLSFLLGEEGNFKKHTSDIDTFKTAYDYQSIMHYGRKTFSKNGQDTIVPKNGVSKRPGIPIVLVLR